MDREAYFDGWQRLHGGYDPRSSALVRGWLSGAYVVAKPFAALGVPPDVVTLLGVLVGAVSLPAAHAGRHLLLVAALVVVVSGLLDNVDGAVAVMTGRASAWGQVLDAVADRIGDLVFITTLFLAGARLLPCLLGALLMLLQEYIRARAGAAGLRDVGVITVWERPTRVIVTAGFLGSAWLLGHRWAEFGSWAWVGLGVVGMTQLVIVVRRRLGRPD